MLRLRAAAGVTLRVHVRGASGAARALAIALVLTGCGDEVTATLVGLQGCGLEGEMLDTLRILPRGDFPESAVDATVVHGGNARLPEVPADANAITVEGLVGDISIAVGRTPRLQGERGEMPVYFAPQDELCPLQSGVDWRNVGGLAVGPAGDIVVVGGRDRDGALVSDVIHTRDDDLLVTPLDRGLQAAATGMVVVPTGDQTFGIFGGARLDTQVLDHWVAIDFTQPQPVQSSPTHLDGIGVEVARGYHAAVTLADGRVLVSGGCENLLEDNSCDTDPAMGSIRSDSFFIDPSTEPPTVAKGDALAQPRFDHQMFVARDGAVFVVGGRTYDGGGDLGIERWWLDAGGWRSYGKQASQLDLAANGPITGAALVEGGLFVVAFERGGLGWIDEVSAGSTPPPAVLGANPDQPDECTPVTSDSTYWSGWCDGDPEVPACLFTEGACPSPSARHRVLALPDERVLVDTWLLPFPHLGTTATHAIDLARRPGASSPSHRAEASMIALADGTVLIAGGRDPDTLEPAQPFFLRLRPGLGGPDEDIPNLERAGGFVLHDPEHVASAGDDGLVLTSTEEKLDSVPAVWAHLRSFRSASFRVYARLLAEQGGVASLVLSQGAVARTTIRFGDDIEFLRRDVGGHELHPVTCSPANSGPFDDIPLELIVDVRPESIVIRNDGKVLARCPGIGETPSAIGFGVAGSIVDEHMPGNPNDDEVVMGKLTATNLRVTRI
jgi:hypothetical protein